MKMMTAPISSGNQPPSSTFRRLEPSSMLSTIRMNPQIRMVRYRLHFHSARKTKKAITVSMIMVPVTAMP